jgi:predicted nucleic acid-binding protein
MTLFDTDVLIDHLLDIYGASEAILKFNNEKNSCSAITMGEILFGMRIAEEKKTYALINNLNILNVTKEIIQLSHDIKKNAKGFELELYDCIIAATAIVNDQILVTRNAKHYPDKRLKLFIPEY